MRPSYLLVFSEEDPVAEAVWDAAGPGQATGDHLAGVPIRAWSGCAWSVRRPGHHVLDDRLEEDLAQVPTLAGCPVVFPSIHRSSRGVESLTVHPLGNLGDTNEVGGVPQRLNPTAPRLMTDALRRLSEGAAPLAIPATFEATHHGPALASPSFFVEIGVEEGARPRPDAVRVLARVLAELTEDAADRVVVGVGGGHYAPHFTDLALRRRWAFGHLVSRHALEHLERAVARQAMERTPECEGALFARAQDAHEGAGVEFSPRLREGTAPKREAPI